MIDDRFPYLEFMYPGAKEVASYPSPRLIKSHLPYTLLPSDIHEKKPKVWLRCRAGERFFLSIMQAKTALHVQAVIDVTKSILLENCVLFVQFMYAK